MDSRLIIVAVLAYLLGSIPFGYILVKLFLKQDIRTTGSGNIGATNVARSGRKGLALATLLLDAAKGALAVYIATMLVLTGAPFLGVPLAAFCAILGHVFPIWLAFKGGKGVATAVGAFALLNPKATALAVAIFLLAFAISRYVSLSSIVSAGSFPVLAYLFVPLPEVLLVSAFSSLLIILKHHANIRRLIAGTEPKFGKKAIGWNDPGITEKNL